MLKAMRDSFQDQLGPLGCPVDAKKRLLDDAEDYEELTIPVGALRMSD